MRAGRLRDKVRLERPVQTRNPTTGSIENAWELVALRSAEIRPLNGSEQAFLGAELIESNVIVRMRYDRSMKDLSGDWRVVDARTNRVYDIEYFDPVRTGARSLMLRCTQRTK